MQWENEIEHEANEDRWYNPDIDVSCWNCGYLLKFPAYRFLKAESHIRQRYNSLITALKYGKRLAGYFNYYVHYKRRCPKCRIINERIYLYLEDKFLKRTGQETLQDLSGRKFPDYHYTIELDSRPR